MTTQSWQDRIMAQMTSKILNGEWAELAHRSFYPDALDHGRHSTGTVEEHHYLTVGKEYVGRHRKGSTPSAEGV